MTFKQFKAWCNDRAADGCWSMATAIYCIDVIRKIQKQPFWKRNKEWLQVKDFIETEIVSVINDKIETFKNQAIQ